MRVIKDSDPFAVFEITEALMASGMSDFLRQISLQERMRTDRPDAMRRLREAMANL